MRAIQAPPHIQIGWQVTCRSRRGGGWRGSDWWHTLAAEFMSQSKSEYGERGHRVTLAILRIIWQCIMSEMCHSKKMSASSAAAEITTCAPRSTWWIPYGGVGLRGHGQGSNTGVSDCQTKSRNTSVCINPTVVFVVLCHALPLPTPPLPVSLLSKRVQAKYMLAHVDLKKLS